MRFITASHPDQAARGSAIIRTAGLPTDPWGHEGIARLAPLGLLFDAGCTAPSSGELVDLARALPDSPFVLDHVGGAIGLGLYVGKRGEWSGLIRELAACHNVHVRPGGLGVRVSGFTHNTGELPPSSE